MTKEDNSLLKDAKDLGIDLTFDDESDTEEPKPQLKAKKPEPAKSPRTQAPKKQETSVKVEESEDTDNDDLLKNLTAEMSETDNTQDAMIELSIIDTTDDTKEIKTIYGKAGSQVKITKYLSKWLNNGYELADKKNTGMVSFKETPQKIQIELKHQYRSVSRKKKVIETIKYSSTDDLINKQPKIQTLIFKQNGYQDAVNKRISWDHKPIVKQFEEVPFPEISGYSPDTDEDSTPAIQIQVDEDNWNSNLDVNKIVNYKPDTQEIAFKILDRTINKSFVKKIHGKTNTISRYSIKPIIDQFIKHGGFKVVKNEAVGQVLKFKPKKQIFNIVIEHEQQTLTVNEPVVKNTGKSYKDELEKTVRRIISFKFDNEFTKKTKDSVAQKAHFTRTGLYDLATKKIEFSKWKPIEQYIPSYRVPSVAGYKVEPTTLASTKVTPESEDIDTEIVYKPLPRSIVILLRDDDLHRTLAKKPFTGKADEPLTKYDYKKDAVLLKNAGYDVNEHTFDSAKNAVFDPNIQEKKIVIALHHTHQKVSLEHPVNPKKDEDLSDMLSKTITRTIKYELPDTLTSFPENTEHKQELTFTRTGLVDMVTGKVAYSSWSPSQEFPALKIPEVAGYTTTSENTEISAKLIPAKKITANSNDSFVEITYKPEKQTIHLVIADETTKKIIGHKDIQGFTDTPIPDSINSNAIEDLYVQNGYQIVSDPFSEISMFEPHEGNYFKCEIRVKHSYASVDVTDPINPKTDEDMKAELSRTKSFVVNYKYYGGKEASKPNVQQMKLVRTATIDMVTGKPKFDDWTITNDLSEVVSPKIEGYTPNKAVVEAPDRIKENSNEFSKTVTYLINEQHVTLNFVDKNKKNVAEAEIVLNLNDKKPQRVENYLSKATNLGYGINKNQDYPKELVYDKDKPDSRVFYINVHETFIENTESRNITRQITFNFPNGTTNKNIQITTLKCHVSISNVTKKQTYSKWSTGFWDEVNVPEIPNYHAVVEKDNNTVMISQISREVINEDTKSSSIVVNYKKGEDHNTPQIEKTKKPHVSLWAKIRNAFSNESKEHESVKALPSPDIDMK